MVLTKKDYEEPRCPLNLHPETVRIPVTRVLERLDAYLQKNDTVSAERHLAYWLAEAENGNDQQGKLTILNEQIGLYRKCGKKEEGLSAIGAALALLDELKLADSVTGATTYLNAATGYRAFDEPEKALSLYRRAREIYETRLSPSDTRLGGLYNNMAVTLTALGGYEEAKDLFSRALGIAEKREHGETEAAVTCLNLADLTAAEKGLEAGDAEISALLARAETLLDTENLPRDGGYAYVCEKCAPVFGYYGWFVTEETLSRRAKEIYERT